MQNTHFNHEYRDHGTDRVPTGSGDRYWAQDLARDFRYLEGLSAEAMTSLFASGAAGILLSGGLVTEGSDKAHVNVTAATGLCLFEVEVADPDDAAIPTPTEDVDVRVLVRGEATTDHALGGTLDGVATNYLKLQYVEADGPVERSRAFEAGSYHYSKVASYQLISDAVAPTGYDVLLATYVGNGTSTLTITQADVLVGSGKVAYAVMRRDSAGRAKVSDPSAADDIATKGSSESAASSAVATHNGVTNPHSAASVATANRLVLRDASGRARFADPSDNADAATKGYVDGKVGSKVVINSVDLGDISSNQTLPALNVGEVCMLRLYGVNTSAKALYVSLPATGAYRMISFYFKGGVSGNSGMDLSIDSASDSSSLTFGFAQASSGFAAEIIYYRIS